MQIYSLDDQGHLTSATGAHRKKNYTCPECKGGLRLRGGRFRQLHFFHLDATACHLRGKSPAHLHIQKTLQKMLAPEKTFIEYQFPQIGRIADVVWPAKKLIFEVQVSPISAEEIRARNRDYGQAGYRVVWILHDRQFNRSYLSAAESALRFSPHYFTNINAFGKGIFYDQHSSIRFKKRITRSLPFPIRFKRPTFLTLQQIPSRFPLERKKWWISFEGDLFHRHYVPVLNKKNFFSFRSLIRPIRILFHLLLEKTTY